MPTPDETRLLRFLDCAPPASATGARAITIGGQPADMRPFDADAVAALARSSYATPRR
ncbi:MAG: hypothetical protein ABR606_15555 [Vicinamibacterales bacterium]